MLLPQAMVNNVNSDYYLLKFSGDVEASMARYY